MSLFSKAYIVLEMKLIYLNIIHVHFGRFAEISKLELHLFKKLQNYFSSIISHLLSLLQSVTLLARSLDASSCMPAVVLYYCTFQGIEL